MAPTMECIKQKHRRGKRGGIKKRCQIAALNEKQFSEEEMVIINESISSERPRQDPDQIVFASPTSHHRGIEKPMEVVYCNFN
jgi:hypothetical protein